MDAHVFRRHGEWFVSLRLAGVELDVAGPFEDEFDANEAAIRAVGDTGDLIPFNHLQITNQTNPEWALSCSTYPARRTMIPEAA